MSWCRMHLDTDAALVSVAPHVFLCEACIVMCFSKKIFMCKKAEMSTPQIRSLCSIRVPSCHVYSTEFARNQGTVITKGKDVLFLPPWGMEDALESKILVFSLWVTTPLHATYHISCMSDIYITVPNRTKTIVGKQQWNNFLVGSQHSTRNCIEGSQHRESRPPRV